MSGQIDTTTIAPGSLIKGGHVRNSILRREVIIEDDVEIDDCIIFDSCDIGRRSKLKRCILEKNVKIPEDTIVGYDPIADAERYHVTESGIVVIEGPRSAVELTTMTI